MQQQTQYAACPNCRQSNAEKVSFTWWGGAIGPALMTQVKCQSCGTQFNGKTGQSNQNNIIIYFLATFVIAFFLCGGLAVLTTLLNN